MSAKKTVAMDNETDPINEYKSSLNDLSFNSKPLINMLTMLSEDYKDSKAPQIVTCIEQRLHSVAADKKLPLLYLLDSICKNVGNVYTKLFTQNIVSTFCDVFEKVDEKTRLSLYKLRQTWSTIFPAKKLYAIDHRIHHKLDPAWPVIPLKADPTPTTAAANAGLKASNNSKPVLQSVVKSANASTAQTARQQQVHINPKFFNDPHLQPPLPAGPEAKLAKQLIQKQNELLSLQKQQLELDVLKQKRELAEQKRALEEKERKLKEKEAMLRPNSPNGKKIKKRKRSRSHRSRSPSPISQKSRSPNHRWSQSPNERMRESPQHQLNRQQSPSYALRHNNTHRPRSRSPNAVKPFISQQSGSLPPIQSSINSMSSNIMSASGLTSQPPIPTTIPAPTILAQPEMLNISHMDSNVVTTMSSMRPNITSHINVHNVLSGGHHMSNSVVEPGFPSWGQDRDYRKELDLMMNDAKEKLRSGAISNSDHEILVREVERQIMDAQNSSAVMNSGTVREPDETFTMLVDGKLRKLFYLDDTTAVVLLNAPQNETFDRLIHVDPKALDPRQISFEGKPTKVYIDTDRGYHDFVMLDFNGQQMEFFPKGNRTRQRIKFGGPAKEIILNGHPFQAKFNGPPIDVWFEGDSSGPHTLKLDGPTPRVKLSDERRYDLWTKIINKATNNNASVGVVNNSAVIPPKPKSDVNALLSQLMAAGMIPNNNNNNNNININNNINNNTNIPKTESKNKSAKDEKKSTKASKSMSSNEPPLELTSDSMKISRPSVVASLYNGIQCTNCSLRFDGDDQTSSGDKTRYSKHLDWHFRQNRRDKAKPNSSATSLRRNWFYPLNLWIQFNEVTEEDDSTGLFQSEEQESDVEEEAPVSSVTAEKDESLNCCAVCGEQFSPHWDEEEEEWRLKNAVKHNNKIYHPLCLKDVFAQTERLEQQLNESINENKDNTIASEESTKTEDIDKSEPKCDVLAPEVSDIVDNIESKLEEMETTVSEVNDKESVEEESRVISEPLVEEIKVFEFEIPLNSDSEVNNQQLVDILETKDMSTDISSEVKEVKETEEANEEENNEQNIVVQQGGIVIKMKASNLQTQPTVQTSEPMETNEPKESEVIIRGHELSSLCNIL